MLDREQIRQLFHRGSLQRARRSILRRLARNYLRYSGNVLDDYGWILNPDKPAMLEAAKKKKLRINWILPGICPAQGGLLTIIRAIQQLEASGHENRLYIMGRAPKLSAKAKESISQSYFKIDAEIYPLRDVNNDAVKDSDALIATSWVTAYAARGIGNTSRKYYFVQDIEHMFYAPGSLHAFARNTYAFGFHGITAGTWIADVLESEFGMQCTPFGFSYDRNAYAKTGECMFPAGKKRVLFYARPETERRGFELGVLALAQVAKRLPDAEFVLVGHAAGSLDLPFKAILAGVLPLSRLGPLYRSCDVALVLSHTNLSLLPLELMACGCAVVSNAGPNTEWLLNESNARIANPDPVSLAAAVIDLLVDDAERSRLVAQALAFAESTDWRREIRIIESALTAEVLTSHRETLPA